MGRFFAPTCSDPRVARERAGYCKRGPGPSALISSSAGAQTASAVAMRGVPAPRACPAGCSAGEGRGLRGLRGRGAGAPRSSEVRTSPNSCRGLSYPRPNLLRRMWGWVMVKEAGGPSGHRPELSCPSPENQASLHLSPEMYLPAGPPTLGRPPRPLPLPGSGAEAGRGRKLVHDWPRAGGVLPSPAG